MMERKGLKYCLSESINLSIHPSMVAILEMVVVLVVEVLIVER